MDCSEEIEKEFECSVCGIPMETDKGVCSTNCFKSDML